ncbi:MAG: hypothetical protein ACIAS6_06295 [Phycisphaerales bacterium JB060]
MPTTRPPTPTPTPTPTRRGGVLKKLLVAIAVVLILAIALVTVEAFAGAAARPTIATDYSRLMHDAALERQRARLGPGARHPQNRRPAIESMQEDVRAATDWQLERAHELAEPEQALEHQREAYYSNPWRYISLDLVYPVPDEGTAEQFERARGHAIDALGEWERRGVFDRSAELVGLGPIARAPADGPLMEHILPHLGVGRQLGRAQAARARLAAEAGDLQTLYSALEETYVLGRQIAGQGTLIDWLVGTALQALGQAMLLDNLLLYPVQDDAWLARVDAMVRREAVDRFPPLADALAGERLFAADFIQRCYTDDGKGGGRFIPLLYAQQMGQTPEPWTTLTPFGDSKLSNIHGRLFMDRRAVDAWLDRSHELLGAASTATGRDALDADEALARHFVASDTWRNPATAIRPSYASTLQTDRQRRIQAAGTRVVLAIERHRLRYGDIPASLDDLGDLLPDPLGTDPFTSQPWDYRPAPVAEMVNGQALLPGASAWPFTLRSRPLPGAPNASHRYDPRHGLLIAEPIQGPEYDQPWGEPWGEPEAEPEREPDDAP